MNTLFATMLDDITSQTPKSTKGSMSDNTYMISLINKIEGYKTALKELHWAAPNNSTHIRIDEFLNELGDFEDAIAEDCQATDGQIIPGTIQGTPCKGKDIFMILDAIKADLIDLKRMYEHNPEYTGVINEVDDFFHTLKKYIYLLRIACPCNKD